MFLQYFPSQGDPYSPQGASNPEQGTQHPPPGVPNPAQRVLNIPRGLSIPQALPNILLCHIVPLIFQCFQISQSSVISIMTDKR